MEESSALYSCLLSRKHEQCKQSMRAPVGKIFDSFAILAAPKRNDPIVRMSL